MATLTAHVMVRNEPLIYYAVRSIYDYVDKVMLWDTGSYDAHTLGDIHALVLFDRRHARKITVRHTDIDVDETGWTVDTWHAMQKANRGRYTKGKVRRAMIRETKTDWFMIVDGDEVHYPQTMQAVRKAIDSPPKRVQCFGIPLLWLDTMSTYFRRSVSGRVFLTEKTGMVCASPNERHTIRGTGQILEKGMRERKDLRVKPYAHFEKLTKPWRRPVLAKDVKPYKWALPPIFKEEPFFLERFKSEGVTKWPKR